MPFDVENRNVSIKEKIILEDTNTCINGNNAIRVKPEKEQEISKQVNDKNMSFKDALIRSNYS